MANQGEILNDVYDSGAHALKTTGAGSTDTTGLTAANTSVNDTASSTTLLALNTARKGATFFNDSSSVLYLKLGATASSSSYTVQIAAGGYFELPSYNDGQVYKGVIDGIWSADSTGSVKICELT